MLDITKKIETLRSARASAIVKMSEKSITAITDNTTPKKDVLATARAAGYLGVKNTSRVIPHCHPLPVESVDIDYALNKDSILIELTAKTIYKTGCEMEALHGVSIVALTIYDMLKPIDKSIGITDIKLEEKRGGKSDFKDILPDDLKAAVIVISDSVSGGTKEDSAGKAIIERLNAVNITSCEYIIIPDEPDQIREQVKKFCDQNVHLVITTGGTGLSPRDNTPEAIRPLLDSEVPGIMEAARSYGQQRTPLAMLSRSIAGMKNKTLVLAMPGSTSGASETMDALFPSVLHIFKILEKGYQHKHPKT